MLVLDQPMIPITVRSGTPRTRSTVAAVWRASWSRASDAGSLQQRLPRVIVGPMQAEHFTESETELQRDGPTRTREPESGGAVAGSERQRGASHPFRVIPCRP